MTDLSELGRLATEVATATEMHTAALAPLLVAAHEIEDDEREWLKFAVGVVRGMKNRGRDAPKTPWRPEIAQYAEVLEPLSLGALAALSEALG